MDGGLTMTCPHQSRPSGRDRGQFRCALGWYGGSPWLGNCLECLRQKQNTPEAKAAFDAKAEAAHPGHRPRISGCCDRADQH
jgi:hypothetical protein